MLCNICCDCIASQVVFLPLPLRLIIHHWIIRFWQLFYFYSFFSWFIQFFFSSLSSISIGLLSLLFANDVVFCMLSFTQPNFGRFCIFYSTLWYNLHHWQCHPTLAYSFHSRLFSEFRNISTNYLYALLFGVFLFSFTIVLIVSRWRYAHIFIVPFVFHGV